jgi:two-component system, LytTR family, sensor kinase
LSSATPSQPKVDHLRPSSGTAPADKIDQTAKVESRLPASLRSGRTIWLLSFALWTAFATFNVTGSYVYSIVSGAHPSAWKLLLTWDFGDAYTWALFTPLIYSLSRRYSFGLRHWKIPFLFHTLAGILFACAGALLAAFWIYLFPWTRSHPFAPFRLELIALFWEDIPRYCLIVAVSQAVTYRNQYREREIKSSQLEMQLAHAQLNALKMQLEPHFLFNVLNSIVALTRKDALLAERMTLQLADLLRMSLQNTGRHEVPLRQELEFLDCYLRIQQTRFHDRLAVRFDIDPLTLNAVVPHLVLQPLVENAIRHGITPRLLPGRIEVQALKQEHRLVLQVLDNGAGLPIGFREKSEHGVGLSNTRARLQQLHGDNFEFSCENLPSGGCGVKIVVPFREIEKTEEPSGNDRAHTNANRRR